MTRGRNPTPAKPAQPQRDEFSVATQRLVAQEVGHRCSNPGCGAPTSGPSAEKGVSNVGVVAHISAAAQGGPRYDASMTSESRRAAPNAIWLCARCARLIDNDIVTFTVGELEQWKVGAVARAHQALVTGVLLAGPTPKSVLHDKEKFTKSNRYMDERELRLLVSLMSRDGNDGWIRHANGWCGYFELEGNQYMQPALRELCATLRKELLWVIHYHGQLFKKENWTVVKRPNVTADQFQAVWAQLSMSVTSSLDAYVVYRRAVKHALAI